MAPEDHPDIEVLSRFATEVIVELGKESLTYYGQKSPHVKFDEELVTKAELHLTGRFLKALQSKFPSHQLFNNHSVAPSYTHEGKRYLWIHDAIDGVDNFQTGIPVWGMSLALMDNFWPIFGVFYMPVTGDLFSARADHPAFRGNKKIQVVRKNDVDDESLLLTYSRFHRHYISTFPGKIRDLGCTTAHICYVAMGRADAAIIANESYQGLAAARVIIEAAGGKILKMDGNGFFLSEYMDGQKIEDHLMVIAPENVTPVRACLKKTI